MSAAEVIAKCVEHDYNRTFHDTALCILGDLKAAGYAVVELPTPDEHGEWFLSDNYAVWLDRASRVQIRTQGYGLPNEVRAFAAALLAAADAAEVVS